MTRHERRKKAIYKKAKIEIYTAMANALHEKHKFGKKRLAEIFELSNKYMEMEYEKTQADI